MHVPIFQNSWHKFDFASFKQYKDQFIDFHPYKPQFSKIESILGQISQSCCLYKFISQNPIHTNFSFPNLNPYKIQICPIKATKVQFFVLTQNGKSKFPQPKNQF